ncbi:MAG: outer membrane protein transport protein [Methylophaga sp.]|nr:outer membrane protein transport protein [Methylophaga sp.]
MKTLTLHRQPVNAPQINKKSQAQKSAVNVKKSGNRFFGLTLLSAPLLLSLSAPVNAGPRGSELDTTLTPASGGMEGVGVVRPQDPVAMIFGNPATLTQLNGSTAFTLGGSYLNMDLDARNSSINPNPFVAPGASGESDFTNAAIPHAAVVHRINSQWVVGGGMTGVSGLASDFRDEPGFPALVADLKLFGANMVAGYQATDNFSVGAAVTIGIGSLNAGLVQNGSSVNGFGVGGSLGATYDFGALQIGGTYKAPMKIDYDKAVEVSPNKFDKLTLEQPQEVTFGISTTDLISDSTHIEINYRFKNWENADGYQDFWQDQHIVSVGAQHNFGNRFTARAGYSYGSDLVKSGSKLGNSFAGVSTLNGPNGPIPISPELIQSAQATITNGYWRQSISVGLSYDLTQTIRLDTNASYAFDGEDNVGAFETDGTIITVGAGFTWRFD